MAEITVQELTTAGLKHTLTAAHATGDYFVNDGHSIIVVQSSVGTTNSVHITSEYSPVPKGLTTAAVVVGVSANAEVKVGFIGQNEYNDSDNLVHISYTTDTSVNADSVRWSPEVEWRDGTEWRLVLTGLQIAVISVT